MKNQASKRDPKSQEGLSQKSLRKYHHEMKSAHGVKSLQTPATYILAIIAALVIYHIDQRYRIDRLVENSKQKVNDIKEEIKQITNEDNEPTQISGILILSILILSAVLAIKRVQNKRQIPQVDESSEEVENVLIQRQMESQSIFCEQISLEEYNYQASFGTKKEILKLVQSDQYREAMIEKGNNIEKWNWQAQDRAEGIYPSDEADILDENINHMNRLQDGEAVIYDPSQKQRVQLKANPQSFAKQASIMKQQNSTHTQSIRKELSQSKIQIVEEKPVHSDSVTKYLNFDTPSLKNKKIPTPSTKQYTLRSSPHILRSTYQELK
ncbi:UNKNOWN [Stylonychia lemnae]|uniref:Uncharacterized protein n=1 Tax=Stylonychia lemnae TaxID=5949 RepID=A0A078BA41_STYLE|nr:UNKNOWN [Stylonychia lemnae]|eukprot:CDW90147.1 UNKNOWN [Stylonychia lemnae]